MKITAKPCQMLVIDDIMVDHKLDPIRVITENIEPGKGRIIIVCYDSSWVGYWGAMGGRTVEEFFLSCDAGYLSSNLGCSSVLSHSKSNAVYLVRVIVVVQAALLKRADVRVCGNCDTALPEGCGGLFKSDGDHCALNGEVS